MKVAKEILGDDAQGIPVSTPGTSTKIPSRRRKQLGDLGL